MRPQQRGAQPDGSIGSRGSAKEGSHGTPEYFSDTQRCSSARRRHRLSNRLDDTPQRSTPRPAAPTCVNVRGAHSLEKFGGSELETSLRMQITLRALSLPLLRRGLLLLDCHRTSVLHDDCTRKRDNNDGAGLGLVSVGEARADHNFVKK